MIETKKRQLLSQIFDANLMELLNWRKRVVPDSGIQTYVEVLIHYLKKEKDLLATTARYISLDENRELYWLASLREKICAGTVRMEHIEHFLTAIPKQGAWRAEMHFVAALAFETCGRLNEAKVLFQLAQQELEALGAKRKAKKAGQHIEAILVLAQNQTEKIVAEKMGQAEEKLSKMENSLLRCMSQRPMTKFELMEKLFGSQAAFQVSEQRIEDLLGSISRKRPKLIQRENYRYSLVAN